MAMIEAQKIPVQKIPSRRVRGGGRRVVILPRQFMRYEKAIADHTKAFMLYTLKRTVKFIDSQRKEYPALAIAEARPRVEFPTRELVLSRWKRVQGTIRAINPHMWDPSRIPMTFLDYKTKILDASTERRFAENLAAIKSSAYLEAVKASAAQLGVPPVINEEALKAVADKTFKIVTTEITPTLANQIKDKLTASINQGMTIEETAHNLGALNTNWRMIARTETMDVVNKGTFDQLWNETKETGAETLKGWLHSGNPNGRVSHAQAAAEYGEGNEIPIDEPFIVGGESMMHPHDPGASAENVVNCGCTVFYTVKGV